MKKNVAKYFSFMVALILTAGLLLTGCSGNNSSTGDTKTNTNNGTTATDNDNGKKLKIAFIPQLIGIPYFTAMEEGGNAAAKDLGVDFIYTGATTASAPEQSRIMDSLIRQGVNAISVSVLDSSSINPIIEKAQKAGIKVYTSDSDSPDSSRDVYVAQAFDNELGYTIVDRIAEQIGKSGEIGIISGESTATNLNTWIKFMKERVEKQYPNMKIVDVRFTQGGSSENALKQAQELMTKYPDIKGLIAVASTTVPGVCQAVQQAGKTGKISVIGYGSPATVKPFIKSGVMKESILWDANKLGYLTVWAGKILADGKKFEAENTVPGFEQPVKYFADKKTLLLGTPLVINSDNVDKFNF